MKIILLVSLLACAQTTHLVGIQPAITNELNWKESLQKSFDTHISFLRAIIDQAESPAEIKDFSGYFDRLISWFTTTIANISSPTDPLYEQLNDKVQALTRLVGIQKNAESTLTSMIVSSATVAEMFPRLRLALLYEINMLLNQSITDHEAALQAAQKTARAARCVTEKEEINKLNAIIDINLKSYQEEKKALKQALVSKLEKTYKKNLDLHVQTLQQSQRIQQQTEALKLNASRIGHIAGEDGTSPMEKDAGAEAEQAQRTFLELELTQSNGNNE